MERYIFILPGDVFESEKQENDWKLIERERFVAQKAFNSLLKYIRNEYLEIDLNSTSREAFDYYKKIEDSIKNIKKT